MSSSGNAATNLNSAVGNFNGGKPSRNDLIPAIVFSALAVLSIPLLVYWLMRGTHKRRVSANGVLFFLTKLAALILRGYMARKSYGEGTLIAELILTSVGYLFLCNALIDLWEHHAEQNDHGSDDSRTLSEDRQDRQTTKAKWVFYLAWFLRGVLVASLITAIVAGAILRGKLTQTDKLTVVEDLIKASYVLSLAATVLTVITHFATHVAKHRSLARTALMSAYSVPLIIVGVYRVVLVFTGYTVSTGELVAFWVAMVMFEVLAYGVLLISSIPHWRHKRAEKKQRQDLEKRQSAY